MNEEEEYLAGEPDDEEDFDVEYMYDEPPDIDFILMPKLDFKPDDFLDNYVKLIRKCKNKTEAKMVLAKLYSETQQITLLMNDLEELQMRAKALEMEVSRVKF